MNPWRGLGGLPREVWLISLTTLVNRMGTMALPFLVLYLTQARGWGEAEAGAAMMVYGAGALTAGPLAGRIADRLGHVRVLRGSLLTSGLALLVLPFATHRLALYPLIFLWAALTQAFWPSAMALLAGLVPGPQRRAAYSVHRTAVNLGMAIGPAAGGAIAHLSYTWVFWTDGLTTLLSWGLLGWLLANPAPKTGTPDPRPIASPWADRRLLLLLGALLPVFLVFFQIEGALPLWVVRGLGLGTRFFGLLFTLSTLLIVVFEVPLNLAMARWPHHRQLVLGCAAYAVGFGLTGLARTPGPLMATVAVWTFGEMVLLPSASDAVASLAPPERRGEYLGLYSMVFAMGLAFGPWLGVLAYAKAGPGWVWTGCAIVAGISAILVGRFRSPEPMIATDSANFGAVPADSVE